MPRGTLKSSLLLMGTLGGARAAQPPFQPAPAPTWSAPTEGIVAAVEAFARAWFEGDAEEMQRCLHPDLVARILEAAPEGSGTPRLLRAREFAPVPGAASRVGASTPEDRRTVGVRVLDAQGPAASVRASLGDWVAFMHLVHHKGRWTIANVLWEWTQGGVA